jgi:ankyrin repeat protein
MSAFRISLLRIFILGIVICHSVSGFAQEKTIEIIPNGKEEIDTSDYLPSFYSAALNYNLMIAASKGYITEIKRLMDEGADINTETIEGATPLIFAVTNNKLNAVNELLKYNPVIDKITTSQETPLIIAVKNGHFEICESLIRAGADVDITDRNGAAPLHHASVNGYLEIADLLLYYNASIDQKSDDGLTPLLSSIFAGYANVADLLIQNGANMEARNNQGLTPFLMAALNGDTLIMDLLFKHGVNIYATNNSDYNALDLSVSANQEDAVRYLLRIGNKWTDSEGNGINPYLVASKYRRKEMVSILRESKVPGEIKYGIDQVALSVSSRFTLKDYYTGISLSFKEPYLNAGIIAGFDFKLWYTRVLVKDSEHLFHQYLDKGYFAYAGAFKDFTLYENPFKSNYVFSASFLAGYSFGHTMKGTLKAPENKFTIVPCISLKWNIKNFSLSMGMEYIKSQFYHIGPLWLRAGFSYTLFYDKVRTKVKPLKWY